MTEVDFASTFISTILVITKEFISILKLLIPFSTHQLGQNLYTISRYLN